jgi:hypothetical protein
MPWVRGHYARSPRTRRRGYRSSESHAALIALAVLVGVVLLVLLLRH